MSENLVWGSDALRLTLQWDRDHAPHISSIRAPGVAVTLPAGLAGVEILTADAGHRFASGTLIHTEFGHRARHLGSWDGHQDGLRTLTVLLGDPESGLHCEWRLQVREGISAVTSSVTVINEGTDPTLLRQVTSWSGYLGHPAEQGLGQWTLYCARSDWMAENRWQGTPLDESLLPNIDQPDFRHPRRGSVRLGSSGTWSTGQWLPVGALSNETLGLAWAWQIEHNGAWRWDVGEDLPDLALALSGPTDADHQWARVLRPGERFTGVPATVALGRDLTAAFGALTDHRRAGRRPHPDNAAMPVIFNDYMNTLNGDPTTEKLLPLVDAAAGAGAEVFVIDAGWYDETGDWWDGVGEWLPSTTRFPGGLGEVIDRILDHGMIPGLWLEPEVIGVRSPMAGRLPDEAFITRAGRRIVEHGRYHLDLRSPRAIAHLDGVVDRLIEQFGVGYFKFDYNIDPHTGSDREADSTGAALLEHNRAYLRWVEAVLERHPDLILENCGSGGMRADPASTRVFAVQSTSDQQDLLRYAPIAAAAPALMLPEQAGNWAYPQAGMTLEEQAFTLVTGLTGRIYLSGYLNRMGREQNLLIREAVRVAKDIRADLREARPFWPLGLPSWDAPVVALGLQAPSRTLLAVWDRSGKARNLHLPLPAPGRDAAVAFPVGLRAWGAELRNSGSELLVSNTTSTPSARLMVVSPQGDGRVAGLHRS